LVLFKIYFLLLILLILENSKEHFIKEKRLLFSTIKKRSYMSF
jgi:hypothetical protein